MTQNTINTASKLLQFVSASTNSVITNSNAVYTSADTIPQITSGTEVITATIIPKSASSILYINFSCSAMIPTSGSAYYCLALFQDATANALAAAYCRTLRLCSLSYNMTSGTTSSTTFRIRIGGNNIAGCYVNANNLGARIMGGVSLAHLTIEEYL